MALLAEMAERDPLFAKELEALSADQRQWLQDDLQLRRDAARLAEQLTLDEGDVYHQLKQLRRSPTARLRLGLAHGRHRPRPPT